MATATAGKTEAKEVKGKEEMWRKFAVVIETTEQILGTQPTDPDVRAEHLELREDEEILPTEPGDEQLEVPKTTFNVDDKGAICLMDYQAKGYFKEVAGLFPHLLGIKGRTQEFAGARTIKSRLDKWLFVHPRKIVAMRGDTPVRSADGQLKRSIRAETQLGPRVALAISDYLNPGVRFSFQVWVLSNTPIQLPTLAWWLEYGEMGMGLLRWRTAGFGRFKVIKLAEVK